jgi:hypothetical protein
VSGFGDIPPIGTHVQVRRHGAADDESFQAGIVVGHLVDPALGNVVELRLSDSRRLQRIWPSPSVRVSPSA